MRRVRCRSSAQGAALLRVAHADDAQPIAQRFDLGQDVAGEQHRSSLGLHLANAVLEYRLHERVESRRRFVEDQQLGVGGQRRDQADLLAVALGVGAGLLGRVELEALEQLVAAPRSRSPRSRPNRSITSPPVRFGHKLTSPGTYANRRCSATASRHGSPPNRVTSPASARIKPSTTRMVVVFPAPFGPRNPCTSPPRRAKSEACPRKRVWPKVFTRRRDDRRGHLTRSRMTGCDRRYCRTRSRLLSQGHCSQSP